MGQGVFSVFAFLACYIDVVILFAFSKPGHSKRELLLNTELHIRILHPWNHQTPFQRLSNITSILFLLLLLLQKKKKIMGLVPSGSGVFDAVLMKTPWSVIWLASAISSHFNVAGRQNCRLLAPDIQWERIEGSHRSTGSNCDDSFLTSVRREPLLILMITPAVHW